MRLATWNIGEDEKNKNGIKYNFNICTCKSFSILAIKNLLNTQREGTAKKVFNKKFYFLFPSPSNSHFQTGTTSISIPSQFKVASSLLVIRIHFESGMKLFNLTNARVSRSLVSMLSRTCILTWIASFSDGT